MPNRLSIVVVEADRTRALLIVDRRREVGEFDISVLAEVTGLARHISRHDPDVVLVDITSPSRDMLEELELASGPLERPVAMFVDRSDDGLTKAAVEAGVSAYGVDGLRADRIKPILDAAIARFHMFQRLRVELETTKRALEGHKVIDRAKGPPLMKARGLAADEIDAFCIGAPWGSIAVEQGVGKLLLPGTAIRAFAPEKVLAARHDWTEAEPDLARRLMRAAWRAGRWVARPENHVTVSAILSRPGYLDLPAEVIERSLSGRLVISPRGEMRRRAIPGARRDADSAPRSFFRWLCFRPGQSGMMPKRAFPGPAAAMRRPPACQPA
ncbi:chemotaxis protein CheY [Defluviimonas sp. 20V17]|uniref:Two-component response regulator, AmiR/NasT family, consists of REC and RNA-binding antiterminator (ANTAR) domains n=1 Tax=Allgaiera indica TaxID=765699 RepID=A0AAN5A0V5_9RHOB|nr:ABC transporter substrate-binding protein [Allgaiera indica]KDB05233.1 chemotaxis protein CheY [Defluviimonas sp. 20V17]GHE05000.1 hypothetical protein GCM10008024_34310 [Allgaiera indica]SDX60955.1 Two-component response regulator, AmiR/NasT family, consists of REC and RNA-binding antiterminator (ANTAR) domains [Allgaiera indica]